MILIMFNCFIFKSHLIFYVYKNALHASVEKGNIEIVRLLLSNPNINVNKLTVN